MAALVCPACGARNPAGSTWCGQCHSAVAPQPAATPAPAPAATPAPAPADTADSGPAAPSDGATPSWTCRRCDTPNPVEASVCSACGTSIFGSALGPAADPPTVEPRRALRSGLALSGRGQSLTGQGLLGVLIAATVVFGVGFGVVLLTSGSRVLGWLLVLGGLGVHVVGAVDAYRTAAGSAPGVRLILGPRVLTGVFAAFFLVLMVGAWQAQSALTP